jgi:protein tyrosine phosphatase (PTP) superfamily phosphohydrolase (DUF442 family)
MPERSASISVTPYLALSLIAGCALGFAAAVAAPPDAKPSDPQHRTAATTVVPPPVDAKEPAEFPGLHQVVAYGKDFYSGSLPEGDEAFASLKALGIRTIISVDGAVPDLARAAANGMRYVHLPIGYNGFDEKRKLELVRAVRDLPKPLYLHCHHGKHRSAGAAGTVAVSLGWLDNETATARMKVSGTAPDYKGLWRCTAEATLLAKDVIDAAPADFPERAITTGLVQLMVETDFVTDHLKAIEKAGWGPPKNHPDLVPVAEAGRLADLLRTTLDDADTKAQFGTDEGFGVLLKDGAAKAQRLEDLLAAKPTNDAELPAWKEALSKQFKLVLANCKECHVAHRD